MGLLKDAWDWVTGHSADTYKDLAKTGVAALSTYASYKDQKAKNELQKQAYDEYMRAAEAAGQEAEAAIDLNLTPMSVSGTPTTKAQVTDYTEATGLKHGGISGLRRGYARGTDEVEVMETDEEIITPDYLMKEEGVNIGEQVFYNTGRGDRANAFMIWDQMSTPDKSIFDFDFEIFFNDGGWRDMIKGEAPMSQGETQMASAPSMGDSQNEMSMQLFNKPYHELNEMELEMFQEEMLKFQSKYMATGGIAGLRKKYAYGSGKDEVLEMMDEESLGDFEFKMEEGVPIGPMAGPDWYIKRIEHLEFLGYEYEEASEIAFDDDKYFSIVGMESAIPRGGDPEQPPIYLPKPGQEPQGIQMAAHGGIIGLRHGGRPGYDSGIGPVGRGMSPQQFMTDAEASEGNPGNAEMYEEEIIETQPGDDGAKMINTEDGIKVVISDGTNGLYQGEPIILQDVMTGKYMVIGNDGRKVEFDTMEEAQTYSTQLAPFAKGGRVKRDNGGIMDLGGMEKDYRFNGGFVPIGEYEKKDDVPARLSKNEFVFTADAVRAAGGGSINKGAKRMYETMKNLEAQPQAKRMTA